MQVREEAERLRTPLVAFFSILLGFVTLGGSVAQGVIPTPVLVTLQGLGLQS